LVKHRGCTLYTVETGTVPVTMNTVEETAMVMLRGMASESEVKKTRSRTRDGLRQRARDGFACGKVPFGYRTELVNPAVEDRKQSKKRIVINEPAAAVIRRIFEMYLDGHSGPGKIARRLNKEGALSTNGLGWSVPKVHAVLRDPRYAGQWVYGLTRVVGREGNRTIQEKAPEKEVIRVHRPDLAIVTPDDWARVQTIIAEKARDVAANGARSHHPLAGTLRCVCGRAMRNKVCHGRRSHWVKRYYVCREHMTTGRCTNGINLPAEEVEAKIIEHVRDTVLGQIETTIRDGIRGEIARAVEAAGDRESEAVTVPEEIEALRRERQRLVRVAAATDDPVAEVVDALKANQERARVLEKRLAVVTRPPIDEALAEQLEASAVAYVQRMRERLGADEAHEALRALFPRGLRFRVGAGLWLIEGSASVPTVKSASASERIRVCGTANLNPVLSLNRGSYS
jgi:hypothetical protein